VAGPNVVVDCDPGHDDAVAILVAAERTELAGITTVSGNAPLELTTRNALLTCQIAGIDVPVHAGADRPLVEPPRHAPAAHGQTGLDGPQLPPLRREPAGRDAVGFLIDTSRRVPELWLVAVGPLTNIALALRADPTLATRLAGISLMGGAVAGGNRTAAAEFNIWADPEAAAVVFGCGVPLRMCGLDVTQQFTVDDDVIDELRGMAGPVAAFVADLFDYYCNAYTQWSGRRVASLHDPCAVLSLTDPHLFTDEVMHVAIELTGTHTRGMTVADRRGRRDGPEPNTTVMIAVDRAAAMPLVVQACRSRDSDRPGL
jgi:inosine-uridine nucleoside N-ribohydrolase